MLKQAENTGRAVRLQALRALRQRLADSVVQDQQLAPRSEHAAHLAQHHRLVAHVQVHQRSPHDRNIKAILGVVELAGRNSKLGHSLKGHCITLVAGTVHVSATSHRTELAVERDPVPVGLWALVCQVQDSSAQPASHIQSAASSLHGVSSGEAKLLRHLISSSANVILPVDLLVPHQSGQRVLLGAQIASLLSTDACIHFLPAEPHLVHVSLHLSVGFNAVRCTKLEPGSVGLHGATEHARIVFGMPVLGRIEPALSIAGLVEARLTEEKMAAWSKPTKRLLSKCLDLFIGQIHQQPVGENQVEGTLRIIHPSGIGTHNLQVIQVLVSPAIFGAGSLHKVQSNNAGGLLCQDATESANSSTQLENRLASQGGELRQNLRSLKHVHLASLAVKHHIFKSRR
mmetsp:Transcript_46766/g.123610  ORF Transcript_46766/g.123610 Transcript_46766/m.123610 type:complete len:401 (+) Transcript_46766:622-1824(+)